MFINYLSDCLRRATSCSWRNLTMLEVSDSLILAQREADYPITKAIYTLFERLGDGPYIASALGVWGMALLAVTLIGASVMMGKKMGAIFRV